MMNMHLKYDNMHRNVMFYILICINDHIITSKVECYQLIYRVGSINSLDMTLDHEEVHGFEWIDEGICWFS